MNMHNWRLFLRSFLVAFCLSYLFGRALALLNWLLRVGGSYV